MIITGFHSIEEKIRSSVFAKKKFGAGTSAQEVKIYYSKAGPRIKKILELAEEAEIPATQVLNSKLDELVSSLDEGLKDHRGIVMEIIEKKSAQKNGSPKNVSSEPDNLVDFDTWIKTLPQGKKITVVILDKVTDPHNVGAIIRSCDQFGISLVIIPEHKASNDIANNEVIAKSSAGSSAWVNVAIVNNLNRAAEKLKEAGFWIYGADAGGTSCKKIDFSERSALVMGSEGSGISELLKKQCDQIVSIPTCGKIDSLNVSVAAGILLYEISTRQN